MVKINSWIGGLSDNDTRMQAGEFPYGENIEIMRDPSCIQLAFKPKISVDTTLTAKRMYCSLATRTGVLSDVFFMGEDGYVINTSTSNTVLTLGNDITACVQYKISGTDYILFFYDGGTDSYMGRISVTSANGSTDWTAEGTYDATYKTLSFDGDNIQVLVRSDSLYVAGKTSGTIQRLSPTGNFETVLELTGLIVGMTDNGSHIRVYTEEGRMFVWDGGSNSPDASIDTGISYIRGVYGTGTQDWVLGGLNRLASQVYMSNGYTYQLYKRGIDLSQNYDISNLRKFDINEGTEDKQFMLQHQGIYFTTESDHIAQFGKFYPTSPFSYNKICTNIDGFEGSYVGALCSRGSFLYFFYENTNNDEGIAYIDLDGTVDPLAGFDYQDSGFLYSPKFVMGNVGRISYELYMRADIPTDTTIVVKCAINGSDTRETISTITSTTEKRHILNMLNSKEYYEIQFKLELSTTDSSATPKIYEYEFIPGPLRREGQS